MWAHQKCQHFTSTTLDFYIPFPPWWLTCVPSRLSGLQICSPIAPPEANERLVHLKNHCFFAKKQIIMSTKPSPLCVPWWFSGMYQTAWIGTAGHLISFRLENHPPVRQSDISRANDPRNTCYQWVGFQGMCLGNHKDKYEIYKNRVHIYIYVNIYSVYL